MSDLGMLSREEGGTTELFEGAINGGHLGGKDLSPAGNDDNLNRRFTGFPALTSSYLSSFSLLLKTDDGEEES